MQLSETCGVTVAELRLLAQTFRAMQGLCLRVVSIAARETFTYSQLRYHGSSIHYVLLDAKDRSLPELSIHGNLPGVCR